MPKRGKLRRHLQAYREKLVAKAHGNRQQQEELGHEEQVPVLPGAEDSYNQPAAPIDPQPSTWYQPQASTSDDAGPSTSYDAGPSTSSQHGISTTSFYGSHASYRPSYVQDELFEGFESDENAERPSACTVRQLFNNRDDDDEDDDDFATLQLSEEEGDDAADDNLNTGRGGARRNPRGERFHGRCDLVGKNRKFQDIKQRNAGNRGGGMCIVNNDTMKSFITEVGDHGMTCADCDGTLLIGNTSHDLDSTYHLRCDCCDTVVLRQEIQKRYWEKISEGTTGIITHSIDSGDGYAGIRKITSKLNLSSSISNSRYYKYKETIERQTSNISQEYEQVARQCVFSKYEGQGLPLSDDGILNVDVSYDGTWHKRGHLSNVGAGFVIEADTGLILDSDVLCKFCLKCLKLKHKYKDDPENLEIMMIHHTECGECQKNYEGTSGGMERQMAVNMWGRSEEKNAMRYTTMISDGDSSSFKALKDEPPYVDHPVEKEECVNHVAKRMGTRLRKLKKETYVEVTVADGRKIKRSILGGRGKLTDETIRHLSDYYGKAIRDNQGKDIESMRKACLSGLKHITSTNTNPDHEYCPTGRDSWCFYNRAIATNTTPPDHNTMLVHMSLDKSGLERVTHLYEDLTSDQLLQKCLKGRTQNANESVHSKLWNKLSKSKYYGLNTVKHALRTTVMEHNYGYSSTNIMQYMDFSDSTDERRKSDSTRDRMKAVNAKKASTKKRHRDGQPVEEDPHYHGGNF
jgi:hypothetical protein